MLNISTSYDVDLEDFIKEEKKVKANLPLSLSKRKIFFI
jgi:hypothetical protein